MKTNARQYGHTVRTLLEFVNAPGELFARFIGLQWVTKEARTYSLNSMGATKFITMPAGYPHDRYSLWFNLRKQDGTPSDACRPHDMGWDSGLWDDGSFMHFDQCNGLLRKYMSKENQARWKIALVLNGVGTDIRRRKWKAKHGHD